MPKVYVDRPKAIIFDFVGSAIKIGFIEKGLYAYVKKFGEKYLEERWNTKEMKATINAIRTQINKDRETNDAIPALADASEKLKTQIDAIMANVNWYLNNNKETNAHFKLKYAMWKDAYENQRIETHIYSDAARNIKRWRKGGIKTYIYSNAWAELQKLFLRYTTHGNLSKNIDGYFDTDVGKPNAQQSYAKILEVINIKKGKDVLFLTKSPEEAYAAKEIGIVCILVISHASQLKKIDKSVFEVFQKIRSFDELKFTDEQQEEEEFDDDERDEDW